MQTGSLKCFYFLIIVISLTSCRKDQTQENPCDSAQEVKADFVIEELVGDRYFDRATIADYHKANKKSHQHADDF